MPTPSRRPRKRRATRPQGRSGEVLRDLTQENQALLARSREFVYRHDTQGVFDYMSPSCEAVTGYTPEEWLVHSSTYMTDSPLNAKVYEYTEETLRSGKESPPYFVELVCDLGPGVGSVEADPAHVEQVLLDLAANARDAMPKGGRLTIHTYESAVTAEEATARDDARTGPHVVLEVAERHDGPIHLLVADVVLPGIRGPEVARKLLARRPGTTVLYVSGYSEEFAGAQGGPASSGTLLPKPFPPEALARRVRDVLDQG